MVCQTTRCSVCLGPHLFWKASLVFVCTDSYPGLDSGFSVPLPMLYAYSCWLRVCFHASPRYDYCDHISVSTSKDCRGCWTALCDGSFKMCLPWSSSILPVGISGFHTAHSFPGTWDLSCAFLNMFLFNVMQQLLCCCQDELMTVKTGWNSMPLCYAEGQTRCPSHPGN